MRLSVVGQVGAAPWRPQTAIRALTNAQPGERAITALCAASALIWALASQPSSFPLVFGSSGAMGVLVLTYYMVVSTTILHIVISMQAGPTALLLRGMGHEVSHFSIRLSLTLALFAGTILAVLLGALRLLWSTGVPLPAVSPADGLGAIALVLAYAVVMLSALAEIDPIRAFLALFLPYAAIIALAWALSPFMG